MNNKQIAISILAFIAVFIYSPLISLWALETIFQLKITYSFWSWLAMTWVHLIIFLARSSTTTTITAAPPTSFLSSMTNSSKENHE